MYHFLSSNLTKLNLENWTNYYFDPHAQEKNDYVLVNQRVWDLLKTFYGGGPEIPFFLIDDTRKQKDYNIQKDPNFLFHQPYIYGYPDKNPVYLKIDFVIKNEIEQSNSEETLRVPYTLLVSLAMTFEQFIYYCAVKL